MIKIHHRFFFLRNENQGIGYTLYDTNHVKIKRIAIDIQKEILAPINPYSGTSITKRIILKKPEKIVTNDRYNVFLA